jgi:hypothetical protein
MKLRAGMMIALILMVGTGLALASTVGAKFKSASASVCGNNDLCVSFDEVGAGAGPISYTVTANTSAKYCATGTGSGSFPASTSHNNVVESNLDTGITPPSASGTTLASVSYTNVNIKDNNNNLTAGPFSANKTVTSCP